MRGVEKDWMIRDIEGGRSTYNSSGTGREDGDQLTQVLQAVLVDFGAKDNNCLF